MDLLEARVFVAYRGKMVSSDSLVVLLPLLDLQALEVLSVTLGRLGYKVTVEYRGFLVHKEYRES